MPASSYAGGAMEGVAPADTVVCSTVIGERWADAADLLSTPDEVVSVHFAGTVVVATEADVEMPPADLRLPAGREAPAALREPLIGLSEPAGG